jgi:DNA-binding GntR family transcriptional regulator
MVPRSILRDRRLSINARYLISLLVSYAWQDGYCFPGQERLREDAGWKSVKTVQRALAELEKSGYLGRSVGA